MPRYSLLVTTPQAVFCVDLPEGEYVVGRGSSSHLRLEDRGLSRRHLVLGVRDGLLEVGDRSENGTALNDVQLSGGTALARPGDQISLGEAVLIVLSRGERPPAGPRIAPREELEARLPEELERVRRRGAGLGLLALRLPSVSAAERAELAASMTPEAPAFWGELGSEGLELVCPEVDEAELSAVRDRVTAALGASGRRFRLGYAWFPGDGLDAEALEEVALQRLSGALLAEEPLFLDPVMVRLVSVAERLARSDAPVGVAGEPGVGKEVLARLMHRGRTGGFMVVRGGEPDAEGHLFGVDGRAGALEAEGTVLVKRAEALPSPVLSRLVEALRRRTFERRGDRPVRARVIVSVAREELPELLASPVGRMCLRVPALVDRPSELLALADHLLARLRKVHARPRLALSAEARAALEGYGWPGNVRELKNAIERAVLATEGEELRAAALPAAVRRSRPGAGGEDLRQSLRAAERGALLEALSKTRWNVTETARRLGMPRRTVVYRMARLGLRRPLR